MKDRLPPYTIKTPGTLRKPAGHESPAISFVAEQGRNGRVYRVVSSSGDEEKSGEPLGAKRRTPPMQIDDFGRPLTRSWRKARMGGDMSFRESEDWI